MKYRVYQIKANELSSREKLDALYDAMMGKVIRGLIGGFYELAATIEANDLEEVFNIGNGYGDESAINRHGKMTSVSVGNLVMKEETGEVWACASVGWEKLV